MPVAVRKRAGKYRLVEPDGKIAKTSTGQARDGGGHLREDKARRQQRAINRNL